MYGKRKPTAVLICMRATSVFLPRCSMIQFPLQLIWSASSLESTKTVESFLYGSQGEAKVFPTFTGPLRTSRSFYWSRQVLWPVCWFFDFLVKSGIWTDSGGRKSQTIVSPATPPGSASHTKGRFASSKTWQYNLQGAINDDLVVF